MRPRHNVFCLEGSWYDNLHRAPTVRPALEMLEKFDSIQFVHRDCGTAGDLTYYIDKWKAAKYASFPILYLAFHGEPKLIHVGEDKVSLDDFAEMFSGSLAGRVIVFGTCATLKPTKKYLRSFLKSTGALAVCGYRDNVDFIPSTAFDLMLLHALCFSYFTKTGLRKVRDTMERVARATQELDFSMVLRWEEST